MNRIVYCFDKNDPGAPAEDFLYCLKEDDRREQYWEKDINSYYDIYKYTSVHYNNHLAYDAHIMIYSKSTSPYPI